MALRLLVDRLLHGGLVTCLETTDKQGAVKRQWMGYRGDGEPQRMDEPPSDRIGPIRIVDLSDEGC
jgi:hypothetical protein